MGNIICIVDDDLSVRRALGRLIKSFGFEPCLMASARECLDASYIDEAACLIVDVSMPDIDGFELHALLQAADRSIPTIFISADDGQRVQAKARSVGGIAFLGKPCDEKKLHEAIDMALSA